LKAARFLASVVGIAHGRQMGAQIRRKYRAEVNRNGSKDRDSPSWVWSSIVGLVAAMSGLSRTLPALCLGNRGLAEAQAAELQRSHKGVHLGKHRWVTD
jgi:hypothetical protein